MAKAKQEYGNESITSLKGADRVRKRPAVIFGSDGLEGCEHSVFEILSNSIDEAREGFGSSIIVTKYLDGSIQVEDFGRGIRWTITKTSSGITGNWCSVSSTPEASTKTTPGTTTSFPWASTV